MKIISEGTRKREIIVGGKTRHQTYVHGKWVFNTELPESFRSVRSGISRTSNKMKTQHQ